MNIAIVSPHPDDETLGAGGTIAKFKKNGHNVYWINITNIIDSKNWKKEFKNKRKKQIENIKKHFNFDGCFDLNIEPCTLEMADKSILINEISKCFEVIKPEIIFLPNPDDAHSDHKVVFESCMACTKIFRYPYIKKIVTMEILSETDFNKYGKAFNPNYFVDISDTIENKIEGFKVYDTEIGNHPFPRSVDSILALAMLRGVAAGCKYAEAFNIVKWVD